MTCKRGDILELGPELGNGMRVGVRHTADHQMQVGQVRPVREGENLVGGRYLLGKTDGQRMIVESELDLRGGCAATAGEQVGPAMVTSDEYREGWDRVFGPAIGQA
jgi:hypothetical protein